MDEPLIVELYKVVREYGPHTIELIECSACRETGLYIHPRVESLCCLSCGHRNATPGEFPSSDP